MTKNHGLKDYTEPDNPQNPSNLRNPYNPCFIPYNPMNL
jgi:hypothetical protein